MAKTSSRVVLNRSRLDEVTLGVADGMETLAQNILAGARVPDAPPYGVGLVETGGYGVWVNGRKVAGPSSKPRGVRLDKPGVTAVVGYGFPGRFLEMGTIDTRAQPFLTPAGLAAAPTGAGIVKSAVKKRVA